MDDKKTLAKLNKLFRKYPQIIAVYLYGSRITGHAHAKSDLDMAMVVDNIKGVNYGKLYGEVNEIVKDFEVDVRVVTRKSGLTYLMQVIKPGKFIFERSFGDRVAFESGVLKDFYDEKHSRNIYNHYTKLFFEA